MSASNAQAPDRLESWRRRTATVTPGTSVKRIHPAPRIAKPATTADSEGPVALAVKTARSAKSPEPNGPTRKFDCGADPAARRGMANRQTPTTRRLTSIHDRYSLRLARPRRRNAFATSRAMAVGRDAPEAGGASASTPVA